MVAPLASTGALAILLALVPAARPGWAAEELPVVAVADGLFVHVGAPEDFTAANRGGIANLVLIVGAQATAVVDTGGSLDQGLDWRATVAGLTDRPVAYVINTHLHPDHLLGNAAFAGPGATVVGHARLPAAMAARGPAYLANMARLLGPAAEGSTLVPPTLLVEPGSPLELDLGGRVLELRAWPTAHTDTDLTVFDRRTGTLIAGDLLFVARLPVVDGRIRGWLAVLDELADLPAERVVPGHGPASLPLADAIIPQRDYLAGLATEVRGLLDRAVPMEDAADALPPPRGWALAAENHPRNVIAVYRELEWE